LRLAMPFMSTTMSTTCSVAKERCGRGCGRGTGRAEPGGAGKGCGRRSGRVVRRFVDPPLAKAETSPASWCGGCRSGRAMAGSACICRRSRCFGAYDDSTLCRPRRQRCRVSLLRSEATGGGSR
jgi:hypothetical protein